MDGWDGWTDELSKTFTMPFLMVGCVWPIVTFQSKGPLQAECKLIFCPHCRKGSWEYDHSFPPEPPLGHGPVTLSHSLFMCEVKAQDWGSTSSGHLHSWGGQPLPVFPFTSHEHPRLSYWFIQPLFRMFVPGPHYLRTRFLPAFEQCWQYCQLSLGHLLWIFSPGWSAH